MYQNTYNLYSWNSPTCFDPAGSSSGRIVCYTVGCTYTVQWERAFAFILRRRMKAKAHSHPPLWGILYCPRSGYNLILRCEVSCTVCGQVIPWSSVVRYLVLSAVRVYPDPPLWGILYCPRSGYTLTLRCEVSCTVRSQGLPWPSVVRYLVLSAVRVYPDPPLWGILYCPRSGYTLTAASTRYLTAEDESKGTFSLNCISAFNSVTDYSPWRWPSRVETCSRFLRIKIVCILVH
jgi:hypothetical protein